MKDHRFISKLKAIDPNRIKKFQMDALKKITTKSTFVKYETLEKPFTDPQCTLILYLWVKHVVKMANDNLE